MVFGRYENTCGYTPDEVRALSIDDVERTFRYWTKYPPLNEIVRGYLFGPPDDDEPRKQMSREEIKKLVDSGALGKRHGR